MARRRVVAAAAAATIAASCSAGPDAAQPAGSGPWAMQPNATVTGIVDGDTIDVDIDGTDDATRVRLIGIDTPEVAHDDRAGECYGAQATQITAELLPIGTPVQLQRDVEARDDYGRLLAYVYRADDGLMVNLEVVNRGGAVPLRFPPNTTNAAAIATAAREAQSAGRGLWGSCAG